MAFGLVVPGQVFVPIEALVTDVALVRFFGIFFHSVHGEWNLRDPLDARILVVANVLLLWVLAQCSAFEGFYQLILPQDRLSFDKIW